ncbi:MAG TPA: hypothetical protein VFM46_17245, partial [Pseudomonadales bacterium]|nr:hypothetical protein [Pseudomonadales bacterium]
MKHIRLKICSMLLMIWACVSAEQVLARAGDLDSAFGSGGSVDVSNVGDHVLRGTFPLGLSAEGKILYAAAYPDSVGLNTVVGRLNANGSIDSSFGVNGSTLVSASVYGGMPVSMVVDKQNNSFILLQPNASLYSAVIKLQPTGELDLAFGNNGMATLPVEAVTPYGMSLDSQGRVLITGSFTTTNLALFIARLLPDGHPDPSFNGQGWAASILAQPSV